MELIYVSVTVFLASLCIVCSIDAIKSRIRKRKTGISIKESMDLTDLPVVTMLNNGTKLNFLLDTGSDKSHLNSSVIKKIKDYERMEGMNTDLISATGVVNSQNNWIKMPLQYKKETFIEEFMLINLDDPFNAIKEESGVQIHGILGNSFFKKYRYILDFDELVAYTK